MVDWARAAWLRAVVKEPAFVGVQSNWTPWLERRGEHVLCFAALRIGDENYGGVELQVKND